MTKYQPEVGMRRNQSVDPIIKITTALRDTANETGHRRLLDTLAMSGGGHPRFRSIIGHQVTLIYSSGYRSVF